MSGVNNMLILDEVLYSFREGVFSVCVYFCARKMYSLNICLCFRVQ